MGRPDLILFVGGLLVTGAALIHLTLQAVHPPGILLFSSSRTHDSDTPSCLGEVLAMVLGLAGGLGGLWSSFGAWGPQRSPRPPAKMIGRPSWRSRTSSSSGSTEAEESRSDLDQPAFRHVELPPGAAGALYLSSTPSRLSSFNQELRLCGVNLILCLHPWNSSESGSMEYLEAILEGKLPCSVELYPMEDSRVPADIVQFSLAVHRWSSAVRQGAKVLIHCGAGIGRTGMVASCLLTGLGTTPEHARELVGDAGSGPETPTQESFVSAVCARFQIDDLAGQSRNHAGT
jgi:hypothetical protein